MDGIEPIKRVLEEGALSSSFAVVESYRNHSEHAEALDGEEKSVSSEGKVEALTLKGDDEEQYERGELKCPSEFHVAEDVERDYHEYSHRAVVDEADRADDEKESDIEQAEQSAFESYVLLELVDSLDREQTEEESEHHVLVEGIDEGPRRHQVEGDLRDQTEDKQSFCVLLEIRGVGVALGDHKREDGERKSADAGHPLVVGHDSCPEMVEQHKCHREDLECV